MSMTPTHKWKAHVCEARQIPLEPTREDLDAIVDWVGEGARVTVDALCGPIILLDGIMGDWPAAGGFWVAKFGDGSFEPFDPDDFEEYYEPI